jgi:hypothetical protein
VSANAPNRVQSVSTLYTITALKLGLNAKESKKALKGFLQPTGSPSQHGVNETHRTAVAGNDFDASVCAVPQLDNTP